MTNLDGPDPKLVVRHQLVTAHQYLLAARQDQSVPNSVGAALQSLHAAVSALADIVLADDVSPAADNHAMPRGVPRDPEEPNIADMKF